jgi:hypothetical protein
MPRGIEQKSVENKETAEDFSTPIWTNPVAWAIAAFNFIHVGFESAMGGWLKTYTQRVEEKASVDLFPPIFLYFVFFVVGRGVAPLFFSISERKPDAAFESFDHSAGNDDFAFRRRRFRFKRRRFDRRFRHFLDLSDQRLAFYQNLRRIGLAPGDAVFYLRHSRRGLYDLDHRLYFQQLRQPARGHVRFAGERFDFNRSAEYFELAQTSAGIIKGNCRRRIKASSFGRRAQSARRLESFTDTLRSSRKKALLLRGRIRREIERFQIFAKIFPEVVPF